MQGLFISETYASAKRTAVYNLVTMLRIPGGHIIERTVMNTYDDTVGTYFFKDFFQFFIGHIKYLSVNSIT